MIRKVKGGYRLFSRTRKTKDGKPWPLGPVRGSREEVVAKDESRVQHFSKGGK